MFFVQYSKWLKPYRIRVALAFCALVAAALLTLLIPFLLRQLVDRSWADLFSWSLSSILISGFSFIAVFAFTSSMRFYCVSWLGERVMMDIRDAFFRHVMVLPISYHDRQESGQLASRMMSDTLLIERVVGSSLSVAIRNAILLVGSLILLWLTAWKLAMIAFVAIPICLVPMITLGRWYRCRSRDSQERLAISNVLAMESISSIRLLRAYHQEEKEIAHYRERSQQALDAAVFRIRSRAVLSAVVIFLSTVLVLGLFLIGRYLMHAAPLYMTGGVLLQFMVYALIMATSSAALSETWGDLQRAAGAMDRLDSVFAVAKQPVISAKGEDTAVEESNYAIEFDGVDLFYEDGTKALDTISFSIEKGQKIAIVGPSGAGKSTIFAVLLGFYQPKTGSIRINGLNLESYSRSDLSQIMSPVFQQTKIFARSLRENISIVAPEVTDQDVENVCIDAQLSDWISKLDRGLDHKLGEEVLSGGQRQRIGLARAFLHNGSIVLLDEPTNALDAGTEQAVSQALQKNFRGKTCIMIAHRLTAMDTFDQIIVVNSGSVAAVGNHKELLDSCPLYQSLHQTNRPFPT